MSKDVDMKYYILELKEYDMIDKEYEEISETKHIMTETILKEIKENERLNWWFDSNEITKEIAEKYNIPVDNPIEIFNKSFEEFWDFYKNEIGTYPVNYSIFIMNRRNFYITLY